jgi:hypothetical protein
MIAKVNKGTAAMKAITLRIGRVGQLSRAFCKRFQPTANGNTDESYRGRRAEGETALKPFFRELETFHYVYTLPHGRKLSRSPTAECPQRAIRGREL